MNHIPFPLSVYDGAVRDQPADEIWIRGGDYPGNLAAKILEKIREHGTVRLAAIGPQAVNQAMKGIAVARSQWRERSSSDDSDLYASCWFSTVIDQTSQERSRIVIAVFPVPDSIVHGLRSVR